MSNIKEELKKLPNKPGVYIMKDINNNIIYVGKAVILKNRVRQYFNSNSNHSNKVITMVANIHSFEYIITDSELEALILECNLIKQYKPKFNILLKDDKSYPYIKITMNEEFPRVLITRKLLKDGAKYYGPYSSSKAVNDIIDIIREYFPTKRCKNKLKKETRACLNYHIGKCVAPCIKAISKEDYMKMIKDITDFLDGDKKGIKRYLKALMEKEANNLNFEKAAKIRDVLDGFKHFEQEQKVSDIYLKDKDIIGIYREDDTVCIQVFFVRKGKMIGRENYILKEVQDETDQEVLTSFLKQFYTGIRNIPKDIFLPMEISEVEILKEFFSGIRKSKVNISVPKRGDNLRLVNLVNKNAKQELERVLNNKFEILHKLKNILELENLPQRIESYDVSNTGNDDIVVSMVVATDEKLDKKEYKKFKLKAVENQNDYMSMQEAVYRRFKRAKNGDTDFTKLPDIIMVDGGKGHINAVKEVLDELNYNIPLVGMVKNDKHRTRAIIVDNKEIDIEHDDKLFNFITRVQDETHRFAIEYNKKLRELRYKSSSLDDIYGIGDSKKRELIKYFGSIDKIKRASVEELMKVKGISERLAKNIFEFYRK